MNEEPQLSNRSFLLQEQGFTMNDHANRNSEGFSSAWGCPFFASERFSRRHLLKAGARGTAGLTFRGFLVMARPRRADNAPLDIHPNLLKTENAYEATVYQNAANSHGVKNPKVYEVRSQKMTQHDAIKANIAGGSGDAMILGQKTKQVYIRDTLCFACCLHHSCTRFQPDAEIPTVFLQLQKIWSRIGESLSI